jgi:flagellar brake protein
MFQHTQPARLDDSGGTDPWAPFAVQHKSEVLELLRQMRDASAPVVLAAPSGSSLSSTLWSLDTTTSRLSFSADAGAPQLQDLVDADEAVAVCYLDSVKLQFDLDHLILVRSANTTVLQAGLPSRLYRFQRRGSFRVRPAGRVGPQITLRHPALPDMLLELRLLDVSVGGCAVLLPQDVPELRPGTLLHGVQVELDSETAFVVSLQMHHVSSLHVGGHRIGCEWHRIEPGAERALQRYVNQTQKRQRLLSLG